jgi:hypothetical protein
MNTDPKHCNKYKGLLIFRVVLKDFLKLITLRPVLSWFEENDRKVPAEMVFEGKAIGYVFSHISYLLIINII